MKLLKQARNNQQQEAKEIKHQTHLLIEKTSFTVSQVSPVFHGCQEENIGLITVVNFIEETMTILPSYGKR